MKYRINLENYLIIEHVSDETTGPDIVSIDQDLVIKISWDFNDYTFFRWKYEAEELSENEIHNYCRVDENDLVYDLYTCSDFDTLPEGISNIILTIEQSNNLHEQPSGCMNYKIVDYTVTARSAAEKLIDQKVLYDVILKNQYLDDVLWTDDSKLFYDKFKIANPTDESLDAWYSDIINYWDESRTERDSNKSDIVGAADLEELSLISYDPTHIKSRAELE